MKKLLLSLFIIPFAIFMLGDLVLAQVANDPCSRPTGTKSIAISTATTTLIAGPTAGKSISVCNYVVAVAGTTPTMQFEYGTQATNPCDTGTTVLSGPMTAGIYAVDGAVTLISTPAGQQLCLVTTGTPTVEGHLAWAYSPF